ncbi:HlyD family secretion protein [Sulfurirhabdus autotrophica]|uniref:HlyD family secretion protein n=1 Tax=Sulfurirhabdus autotrophica TaxID=1706046 RepID=A0A4R3Y3U6_9PROT|nr:HlyD family efflux transporter periplasmic adaptor subunit [Sulfurirhabdus autotrophica]TCV86400.1 HlyD family secretion protein [Sulfurirhabdus autotrophica]
MYKAGMIASALSLALVGCSAQPSNVYQGYAEGEFLRVAAPYAGSLIALNVQRGNQVQKSAPIFVLEQENEKAARMEAEERLHRTEFQLENLRKGKRPSELAAIRAQRDQVQASLKQSEQDFRRDEKLAATGFISQQKLEAGRTALISNRARIAELNAQLATAQLSARSDEIRAAESDVAAAQATLKQAEWKLAQKSITSPATGLVQDTLYVKGEWVPAGSPVVSLLPPENIKVRFFVTENTLGSLHLSQKVKISCDSCGPAIAAVISYISPQAEYTPPVIYSKENRSKLVFLIEARTSPADAVKLHPGQPVDVVL